jgi:SAM-dependent methyltransferase
VSLVSSADRSYVDSWRDRDGRLECPAGGNDDTKYRRNARLRFQSPPPLSLHAWLRWDRIRSLIPPPPATVLEIGCGEGAVGALLSRCYSYVGVEPDAASFAMAIRRIRDAGVVVNSTVEGTPGRFDLVCAFEVLEHMKDDRATLIQWRERVRLGGHLIVSVPAGRHRFGAADEKAGHYRRYDPDDLLTALVAAGFKEATVLAYGFPLGYWLEAGRNAYARCRPGPQSLEERTAASGRWLQPPDWAAALTRLGSWPSGSRSAHFRWGQGLWLAPALKPSTASPSSEPPRAFRTKTGDAGRRQSTSS